MKTKDQKRVEALARQEHWARMTTAQKLAVLSKRPGQSTKQIAKLTQLTKED